MNSSARGVAIGALYVVAYVALDALSFVQPMLKLGITPWNPDAGLTLAFLLMRGWRQAPWAAVAAMAAEVFVHHAPGPPLALVCVSTLVAVGYGGLAFQLAHRGFNQTLASRRAALELSIGSALAALAIASGYAAAFVTSGILPLNVAADAISRNWVGDLNGVLTLTPLLLAVPLAARAVPLLRVHAALVLFQVTVLAAVMWLVFRASPAGELPLYVLFAPVIWITLTWGAIGASAAALAIQFGFLIGSAAHVSSNSLVATQYFLMTLALTAVLLGAVLAERVRALKRVAAGEAEQRCLLAAAPDAVLATDFQPPALLETDFDRVLQPPLAYLRVNPPFIQSDVGTNVSIDVTSLMLQAQELGLVDFQVRILEDLGPAIPGLIEINDSTGANRSSLAPLLTVTYF